MEINIFNINSIISYSDWNLVKLDISKLYNNNNDKLKVRVNKNTEITSTSNKENNVVINFHDYYITTNDVENVYFIDYVKQNKCLFYNFEYIHDNDDVKKNISFFNKVKEIIKKTRDIDIFMK